VNYPVGQEVAYGNNGAAYVAIASSMGQPPPTSPAYWLSIPPQPFTGEVGNWDPNHLNGLVAPRLDAAWEISGGDELTIFGLY
jgi:hypothetical protein